MNTDVLSHACRQIVLDRVQNPIDLGREQVALTLAQYEFVHQYSVASLDGTMAEVEDRVGFLTNLRELIFSQRHQLFEDFIEKERIRQSHIRLQRQGFQTQQEEEN